MSDQDTARINIPVSPDLLEKLDQWWRNSKSLRSRSDAVRHIIKTATAKQAD